MRRYIACILVASLVIALPAIVYSQNDAVTYQGYLTDNIHNPLDGNYDMDFDIFNSETGGSHIDGWSDTVPVENGFFSIVLSDVADTFSNDYAELWLEVTIENEVLEPRQQITSVPAAISWEGGIVRSTEHSGAIIVDPNEDPSVVIRHFDYDDTDRDAIRLRASDSGSGNVYIELVPGIGSGGASLRSIGGCGRLDLHDDEGGFGVELDGCNPYLRLYNSSGELTIEIDGETGNIYYTGEMRKRE